MTADLRSVIHVYASLVDQKAFSVANVPTAVEVLAVYRRHPVDPVVEFLTTEIVALYGRLKKEADGGAFALLPPDDGRGVAMIDRFGLLVMRLARLEGCE